MSDSRAQREKNPNLDVFLNVYKLDKKDRPVKKVLHKRCNSLVIAFIDILNAHMRQGTNAIIDTGAGAGTSRNVDARGQNFATNYSSGDKAGSLTSGIVLGTGTTAVALADHRIETVISHGTSAGNLDYGDTGYGLPVTIGTTTRQFRVFRTVHNGSGGSITVKEVGLYVAGGSVPWWFMIDHTAVNIAMADATGYTFEYLFSVTV